MRFFRVYGALYTLDISEIMSQENLICFATEDANHA